MILLLNWIKGKLFSQAGLFIGLLIAFILLIIIPNTDTILTRFGFETKTSLKGQLVSAQKNIETITSANNDLQASGRIKDVENTSSKTELAKAATINAKNIEGIAKINANKDKNIAPSIQKLKLTTVIDNGRMIVDKTESDKVSESNINALNETFDLLFPTSSKEAS